MAWPELVSGWRICRFWVALARAQALRSSAFSRDWNLNATFWDTSKGNGDFKGRFAMERICSWSHVLLATQMINQYRAGIRSTTWKDRYNRRTWEACFFEARASRHGLMGREPQLPASGWEWSSWIKCKQMKVWRGLWREVGGVADSTR